MFHISVPSPEPLIIYISSPFFQVIRRGDRRPFYAPAKYVSEIRPAEIEAMRRKYAAGGGNGNGNTNNNGVTSDPNPSDSDSSVGRHKVNDASCFS